MKSYTGLVAYALKKLWLSAAVILVTFAVLLSLFRISLPYLDSNKHLVEKFAQDKYGVALSVGSIAASWEGTGPSLILTDVSLSQNEASPVQLNIEEVSVKLHFWQSLSERLLISEHFELKGLSSHVWLDKLQGSSDQAFPVVDALKYLFLVQLHQFTVFDGQITLESSSQKQSFDLAQLIWINENNRHQGKGEIRVQELANNSASFIVELTGTPDLLEGTLYTKAESLDISPWVNEWITAQYPLQESRANLSAWITFKNNRIDHAHIALEDTDFIWSGLPEDAATTHISGGTVQALPVATGWTFRVDQLVISQDRKTFVTDLIGRVDRDGNALINTVKPIAIDPLVGILPVFLEPNLAAGLNNINLQGELSILQINWQQQLPSIRAKLIDFAWSEYGNMPGFSTMDAEFFWHDSMGKLHLVADDSQISAENLLGTTVGKASFDTSIYLYFDELDVSPSWQLSMPMSRFETDLVSFSFATKANLSTGYFALNGNVESIDLVEVPKLFPRDYLGADTTNFLTRAFSGLGKLEAAELLWAGNINSYPFESGDGVFQANVAIENADFVFSRDWPALNKLSMNLLFENQTLYLQSDAGMLDQVELKNLRAEIPKLSSSSGIYIAAKGDAYSKDIRQLLNKSNLKDSLGDLLTNDILVDGELSAELSIQVPFIGNDVKVFGEVKLNGADAHVAAIGLDAKNIQGTLSFENEHISANNLYTEIFTQPINLDLNGQQESSYYQLAIDASGDWQIGLFLDVINVPLRDYLSGSLQWKSEIQLALSKATVTYQASLTSPLMGINSTLPKPLAKSLQDTQFLFVNVRGDNDYSNVNVAVGETVNFSGQFGYASRTFEQILLTAGNKSSLIPSSDFTIFANVDEVDINQWNDVIAQFTDHDIGSSDNSNPPLFSLPDRIAIETKSLIFNDYRFSDARINATQENAQWRINSIAKEAIADINIAADWRRDGISVNADKLHLKSKVHEQVENQSFVSSDEKSQTFPLRFKCADCRINDNALGEVDLELTPTDTGILIDRLNIIHPYGRLIASGEWVEGIDSKTNLSGEFTSEDFGSWLDSFAINSGIKDSEAEVNFALHWSGEPQAFSLANLSGEAEMNLSDGYITEVSDKGSRIFTLFSLNSLMRKLSLDFRDVFAQGFFYDDIQGTMQFINGKAITTDTVVDGGAGEIEIAGFTDLANDQINYDINFTPNVTGNLPFLVYFLANPPTAIAALALDQMLTSAKVISNINYKVTGTFDEPVINEIGRDSKEVTLPAKVTPEKPEGDDSIELDRVAVDIFDG